MLWPPEFLYSVLYVARQHGLPFDVAWPLAAADAAAQSDEPEDWLEAFEGTRAGWEDAYYLRGRTRAQEALESLGDGLEIEEVRSVRRCSHCNAWIPADRDRRAAYCSDTCRRKANYLIERQRAGEAVRAPRFYPGQPLEIDGTHAVIVTVTRIGRSRFAEPSISNPQPES